MKVPSLMQLAGEAVADYKEQGLYKKVDFNDSKYIPLKRFEYHNPNSLVIKDLGTEIFSDRLNSLLDKKSKKSLRNLELRNKNQLPKEWPFQLPILESLETLLIGSISQSTFSNFCKNFQSLRTFDIGSFGGNSLEGIGNLKNLEVLCIRNPLSLRTPESIMPIFECTKLKVLDLSRDFDESQSEEECSVVKNYLECNKVLPQLIHLDCKGVDLDLEKLRSLVATHKSLKQVVALGTALEEIDFPGVHLLNSRNDVSLLKCFEHYLTIRSEDTIQHLVAQFEDLTIWKFTMSDEEMIVKLMRIICRVLKDFDSSRTIFEHCVVSLGLILNLIERFRNPNLEQEDLLMVVNQLISSGTKFMNVKPIMGIFAQFWFILGELSIQNTLDAMKRRIIAFAYKFEKIVDHPVSRILLKQLPTNWNTENLLALWPRKDVFEPLIAWISLEPVSRLHQVLQNCTNQEIIKRIASENVYKRIWISGEFTDEQITAMRELMKRETFDAKLVSSYLHSEIPQFCENPNSTSFSAMEFLVTFIISRVSSTKNKEDELILKFLDSELWVLCEAFTKSGLTFSNFPDDDILMDASRMKKFKGIAMWSKMISEMIIEKSEERLKQELLEDWY